MISSSSIENDRFFLNRCFAWSLHFKNCKGIIAPIVIGMMLIFDSTQAHAEQNVIRLYDDSIPRLVPTSILSYGESKDIKLSNLKVTENGAVSLNVTKKTQDDFCLVLFYRSEKEFLVTYLDVDTDFTIHSSGRVLLGSVGHNIISKALNGRISYTVKSNLWNDYDVRGTNGDLYVFAVKGSVNPHSSLPGDQTDEKVYKTSSNVLKKNVTF